MKCGKSRYYEQSGRLLDNVNISCYTVFID